MGKEAFWKSGAGAVQGQSGPSTAPPPMKVNVKDPIAEIRRLMDEVLLSPEFAEKRAEKRAALRAAEKDVEALENLADEAESQIRELHTAMLSNAGVGKGKGKGNGGKTWNDGLIVAASPFGDDGDDQTHNTVIVSKRGAIFFTGYGGPYIANEILGGEEEKK